MAEELVLACGAVIVSGRRPADTWGPHRLGLAYDLQADDVACLYEHVRDYVGGLNVDYRLVNHLHIDQRATTCRFYHRGHGPRGCEHRLPRVNDLRAGPPAL